eukprot:358695-Chlamydomonas_euryale.AAC.7
MHASSSADKNWDGPILWPLHGHWQRTHVSSKNGIIQSAPKHGHWQPLGKLPCGVQLASMDRGASAGGEDAVYGMRACGPKRARGRGAGGCCAGVEGWACGRAEGVGVRRRAGEPPPGAARHVRSMKVWLRGHLQLRAICGRLEQQWCQKCGGLAS